LVFSFGMFFLFFGLIFFFFICLLWPKWPNTNRNQPKCNHSIYDYMQLIVVCDYIWEYLQLQDQLSTNLVIFTTTMQLLENFILLVTSNLHLFSSINRLICPISRNSLQISCILKIFYNDIGVYFNVCTKIIYIYIYI
jgi:hypothetical protein